MDLDGDGFEVLRYVDGEVIGYTLDYGAFADLKVDGTFSFSSGAYDSGYGAMGFTEDGYSTYDITYSESDVDADDNLNINYFVNGESADEEAYEAAIEEQYNKPDSVWYDFTDANIETAFE